MTIDQPDERDLRIDLAVLLGAVLSRWLRVLVVTAALLVITFVVLMFVPKLYESSASILVESRENVFTRAMGDTAGSAGISAEALMSSQIELIRSRDTLLSVIDSQNLRSVAELNGSASSPLGLVLRLFGRAQAPINIDEAVLENLSDRLTVIRERDSAVISVYVRSQDPDLAARIANAVASTHVRRRADLSLADTAEASGWLEQEIEKLRIKVGAAERAVADYRVGKDLFSGTNNTSLLDQQLSNIATQITSAQERKNTAASRATLIRGLANAGQSLEGVPDVRESTAVQQLVQSKAQLQGQLAQLSATLLDNHPTIRALRAQIAEVDGQVMIEARRVASALEAEARIEGDLEASLRDDLARLKISASSATQNTVTLDALEREAKAQRDLLESYLLRYRDAVSRTESNSALPDVRVVSLAAPSVTPASPKTGLTLGAVAFVALTLQVGGILFGELMSGRALTPEARPPAAPPGTRTAAAPAGPSRNTLPPSPVARRRPRPTAPPEPAAGEAADVSAQPRPAASAPPPAGSERAAAAAAITAAGSKLARPAAPPPAQSLANLSADIAIGRVRVLVLAGLSNFRDVVAVADSLTADGLRNGLSVVCVDAGSGRMSSEAGISDLAADEASFGDVVHKINDGLAEVPWGRRPTLDRRSLRPLTLVEALSDLYEVVIVTTGRLGLASSLPLFSGLDCRLVLVGLDGDDSAVSEAASDEAAMLGFHVAQIVAPPQATSEVA